MRQLLCILIILAHVNCIAQDSLFVKIEGGSHSPVNGEEIDRKEAILDASMKVDRKLNFNIILMIERENYTITDLGYDSDSIYNIILEGNVPLMGGNPTYVRVVGEKKPPRRSVKADSNRAVIDAKMKAMAIDTLDIENMIDSEYYIVSPVGYVNDSTYQIILEGWAVRIDRAELSDYAKGGAIVLWALAAVAGAVLLYSGIETLNAD